MKITLVVLLLALLSFSAVKADEWDALRQVMHDACLEYRIIWTEFQREAHSQEQWEINERCMGVDYETQVVDVIINLFKLLDNPNPITEMIKIVSESYKAWNSLMNDCQISEDFNELRQYCKDADCSVPTLTKRAYANIAKIRELGEEISEQKQHTEEADKIVGKDFALIAKIVLGMTNNSTKEMTYSTISE